jgi:hypothetical protein
MKKVSEVADADVDRFVAMFEGKLNADFTAEVRADAIHDFVLGYIRLLEPDVSEDWIRELARKVRARALWLKA